MAVPTLATAPVLSTPDTHIFEDPTPAVDPSSLPRLSDEQVALTYEIGRTVREIREGRWKRIALQFPDHMLVDAPRVYEQLARGLARARTAQDGTPPEGEPGAARGDTAAGAEGVVQERLFILGDTSYGACCVDEVAAEHVDADIVVHYGRSCLSPPSRLPVVYVFTERALDLDPLLATFKHTYPDTRQKIILMADIPYAHHIPALHSRLQQDGYTGLHATAVVHNPSSLLPNRTTPPDAHDALADYALFHVSDPPTSLLLTLSSRVSSIHIYPTDATSPAATLASTTLTLRRRYALLTSLSTTPIFGILINTLSVKNYMHMLAHVQAQIAAAGKKSYTFVVGKVNAAKVANFSEVGGWVVIGCWESSLLESRDFWRPVITPFELGLALMHDGERLWTGEWTADFAAVLERASGEKAGRGDVDRAHALEDDDGDDDDDDDESAPPEFDLRTGRYVSHSRPMRAPKDPQQQQQRIGGDTGPARDSTALARRAKGELASVAGVVSPGAEYLRSQRTWQGLGSDYNNRDNDEGEGEGAGEGRAARMEEGRRGIASGYVVGGEERRH